MKVVIAGGGTAGHVFPAIALADRLKAGGDRVSFIGSPGGQEANLVPAAGYPFHAVAAAPLKRELSLRSARAPLIAARSVRTCVPWVRDADVVVGVGGYVSVPPVLAARWSRRPILLHEQNAVPSLSNRALSRLAKAVAISFEVSADAFGPGVRTVVTGNPVRAQVARLHTHRAEIAAEAWSALDLDPSRTTVSVFGGSLGALHLDQMVAGALARLRHRSDLQLLVLTGREHLDVVAVPAADIEPLRVRALGFLEAIGTVLAVTDLAVARAGAGHIAELTDAGIPSILVPYPHATENHQEANARAVVAAGAAELVLDSALSPELLARRILDLVDDPDRRASMAEAARAWAKPDADQRLAELVREVAS